MYGNANSSCRAWVRSNGRSKKGSRIIGLAPLGETIDVLLSNPNCCEACFAKAGSAGEAARVPACMSGHSEFAIYASFVSCICDLFLDSARLLLLCEESGLLFQGRQRITIEVNRTAFDGGSKGSGDRCV